MGFLHYLRKIKKKQHDFRVLILGLDNAGKTTIVKRLLNEEINDISPTLGFNIKTVFSQNSRINLWDVGGQKSLRDFWRNYFESNDGLIWVVDSTDRARLQDCRDEFDSLLAEEKLKKCSVLILLNKIDLETHLTKDEVAEVLEIDRLAKSHYNIFECSAVDGQNIFEAFDWLISDIRKKL